MFKRKKSTTSDTRWWRKINQKPSKALSDVAKDRRRRFFFKCFIGSSIFILLAVITCFSIYIIRQYTLPKCFSPFSALIQNISFQTDGVLNKEDIVKLLGDYKGSSLMSFDIYKPKELLEKIPQVKFAILERHFPSTLSVSILERRPVFKLILNNKGHKEGLLVSENGEVFKGYRYPASFLKKLLYITDVELIKQTNGEYAPILGLESVYSLTSLAQERMPHIYATWASISMKYMQFGPDALGSFLKVKTKSGLEIIFSPKDYLFQLERLDSIFTYVSEKKLSMIERIDLSINGQVSVKMVRNQKGLPLSI